MKPTAPVPPRPQTWTEMSWSRSGTSGNLSANMTSLASSSRPSLLSFPFSNTNLLPRLELRQTLTETREPGARDSRMPVRRTGELEDTERLCIVVL